MGCGTLTHTYVLLPPRQYSTLPDRGLSCEWGEYRSWLWCRRALLDRGRAGHSTRAHAQAPESADPGTRGCTIVEPRYTEVAVWLQRLTHPLLELHLNYAPPSIGNPLCIAAARDQFLVPHAPHDPRPGPLCVAPPPARQSSPFSNVRACRAALRESDLHVPTRAPAPSSSHQPRLSCPCHQEIIPPPNHPRPSPPRPLRCSCVLDRESLLETRQR